MKAHIPTLKNFVGGLLFGLLVVSFMILTTGCSKDKKGGVRAGGPWPRVPGQPGWPNQPGWPGGGGYGFGNYLGNESGGRYQLALSLSSDGSGAVWAQGELNIVQPVQCNGIFGQYLSPGVWYVESVQPAYLQGSSVNGLVLQAQDPYSYGYVQIVLRYATLFAIGGQGYSCSGYNGYDELSATVDIYLMNQHCNTSYIDIQTSPAPACYGYY